MLQPSLQKQALCADRIWEHRQGETGPDECWGDYNYRHAAQVGLRRELAAESWEKPAGMAKTTDENARVKVEQLIEMGILPICLMAGSIFRIS